MRSHAFALSGFLCQAVYHFRTFQLAGENEELGRGKRAELPNSPEIDLFTYKRRKVETTQVYGLLRLVIGLIPS